MSTASNRRSTSSWIGLPARHGGFHVSTPRWVAIPEPTQGLARLPGTAVRYELYPHNYLDQNGDSQELIVRADSESGYTWMYRGANGSWKDIGQDE